MPTIKWEGISITIFHSTENWHKPYDHIEVRADQVLPITETGYRSHFIHPDELALFDSPEDFVRQWLDEGAKDPAWKQQEFNSRQGELDL